MKIFAAQLNPTIGDVEGNTKKVLAALERARRAGAEIVLFPELVLTGYPPEDLLLDRELINAVEAKLEVIAPATRGLFSVVGLPRRNPSKQEKPLYNSAAIFADGKLLGFHDKILLPTYDVFDERRFFEPGAEVSIWEYKGLKIGVTICEDLWQHGKMVAYTSYRNDPVFDLKKKQPGLVLNLSGSPYHYKNRRISVFQAAAKTFQCPLVFCNQVGANDQLVFDGHSFCLNGKGELTQIAKGFEEEDFLVDLSKQKPCAMPKKGIEDLFAALVLGTRDYFHKQGFQKALLGLSGGIDSALVACIAKEALGASNVLALALPTRYSSPESFRDAEDLAKNLGIALKKVEIDPVLQMYLDLLQNPKGLAEENLQPRIRGMVLMAFSNQSGALLLNTGNKSEFAMGYTTLYGDMCGALGVLLDVTKDRVYELARFVNRNREIIPDSILKKVPTAELRPGQTDQDTLPPYEVLDPIIHSYIEEGLSPEEVAKKYSHPLEFIQDLVHRIHLAEYKRRQAPIGIRVTPKSFSKGRNVPIVQKYK